MHPLEMKAVLQSFSVISDTREHETQRAQKRYKSMNVPIERAKLDYGDYSYNCTLPDGKRLYDIEKPIFPCCVVERKESLDELAQCFTRGRDRFEREFTRARDNGSRIYLLVENASWENLINGKYRTRFNANAFTASQIAWMVRFNMNVIYCKEETSGRIIKEILYRDLKERLERGDYG